MIRKEMGVMLITTALTFCFSGCTDKDVYQGPKDDKKEFNDFEFSTIQNEVNLEVSYLNCGVEANVYFELYDEMPVTLGDYNYIKRDDVSPLFTAYTADNGVYNGKLQDLPAYVKKVYIYTPAFFAQTLIEAEVVNGSIKATDEAAGSLTRSVTSTTESNYSYMSEIGKGVPPEYQDEPRWKEWLGTYDKYKNGDIEYKYEGNLAAKTTDGLYTAHTQVIDINKACPEKYRSYSDMYLSKDAEVAVTFLGQNTCWNSSLGYYYYKEGEKPTNLKNINVIMLFPNTQDGEWSRGSKEALKTAGINRLTAAQLKFYPNIANGNKEGETTTFPSGYRIGFVLANNAWSNPVEGHTSPNRYRSTTSEGLSVNNYGNKYNEPRTAVYRYGDWVMISFEDFINDQNFSDVVITMKSNPVDAVTDIPTVNPDDNKTTIASYLKGIYAFEDLWPNQGDYDMNDVMARYSYGKTLDKNNKIYSETFTFKTFQNFASNKNGLAFRLNTNGSVASATFAIRKNGENDFTEANLQYEENEKVYILTDDVKLNMGAEYRITVNYNETVPVTKESEVQPFIFRYKDNGKRWEVHLPRQEPTSKVDESDFGKGDDASKPNQGIYYVRSGSYPFAIFLSGANENDLSKMLDRTNESVHIDQLYSGYTEWATSNGTKNQDWYKK